MGIHAQRKDIAGDRVIIEDTGGEAATVTNNRLDTNASITPVPSTNQVHFAESLFNGANDSMDVDGDPVAVVFEYENTSGVNEYITHINLTLTDGGSLDTGDFGGIGGGITNGLLIEFEISSTDYQYSNPTNNRQLISAFTASGAPGGKPEDWLDQDGQFNGNATLDPPVCLSNGDKVKATVRDDLADLNDLFMGVRGWRQI